MSWGEDPEVWSWSGYFGERLTLTDEPATVTEPRTVLIYIYDGQHTEGEASVLMTAEHARELAAELTRWADR